MCLYAKSPILITDIPIKVFKVLQVENEKELSAFRDFKFGSVGTTYSTGNLEIKNGIVEQGFHAFINEESAKNFACTFHKYKVVPFTILPGSQYVLGDRNDIVCNLIRR
jgi:hypothetical protein